MALTKVDKSVSSTPSIVDNGDATAITITSGENVGIGTTTINTGTLGPNNTFLEVAAGTNSGSGTIILSRTTSGNNNEVGGLRFVNSDNADDDGLDSDGKLVAAISARAVTSDSNAGDDSGADLVFYTKPEAGNYAERMRIDSSGRVTTLNQPHVFGSPTNTTGSGSADTFTAHSSYSRNTITVSTVGGVKRFIAPVDGVYHMSFNTIMDLSYNTRHDTKIFINGVEVSQTLNETDTSGYKYRSQSVTVLLDANDYVTIYSPDWYDAATTTFSLWRTFSMVLLG